MRVAIKRKVVRTNSIERDQNNIGLISGCVGSSSCEEDRHPLPGGIRCETEGQEERCRSQCDRQAFEVKRVTLQDKRMQPTTLVYNTQHSNTCADREPGDAMPSR